jgi:hypothetical protein
MKRCCCLVLPLHLNEVLSLFRGFHVLKVEERDPDTRAFLVAHFAKSNPSIIHADFDGDGLSDYAVLLKKDKGTSARFVAVLCPVSGALKTVYDLDLTGSTGDVYLKRIPPGVRVSQTEAIEPETIAPVRLRSAGIQLVYFEKAAVVVFWNPKLHKMQEIQTGD